MQRIAIYTRPIAFSSRGLARGAGLVRTLAASRLPSIPIDPIERTALGLGSAFTALRNPERADAVATLGEVTGGPALERMRRMMQMSDSGRSLLEEKPRVTVELVESWNLGELPQESFGRAYHNFMTTHGFDASSRLEVRYVQDPELRYVMQRYREVHDFLHALTELPPTVLGELALKWVEMVQTGLPMTALASCVGPLKLSHEERCVLFEHYLPWAVRVGSTATNLMSVEYEKELHKPLAELQRELRVEPAPIVEAPLAGSGGGLFGALRRAASVGRSVVRGARSGASRVAGAASRAAEAEAMRESPLETASAAPQEGAEPQLAADDGGAEKQVEQGSGDVGKAPGGKQAFADSSSAK